MLVLSRKIGESIVIGEAITVTIMKLKGKAVQIGIDAPGHIPIRRSELTTLSRAFELPLLT